MKVLCVLYDDPVSGYPPDYARDGIPTIEGYHGGQTTPTPEAIDFTPGELLGTVSGELGLRTFLEEAGATIAKPAGETFWGGYSGVFHDPDGHPWEIAHNPHWTLDDDGSVKLGS